MTKTKAKNTAASATNESTANTESTVPNETIAEAVAAKEAGYDWYTPPMFDINDSSGQD